MILTEKEAMDKHCPQTMTATPLRRDPAYEFSPSYCNASACMAWRLAFDADGHHVMKQVSPPVERAACSGKGTMPNDIVEPGNCPECDGEGKIGHYERMGYCGLAGKPGVSG